MDGHRMADGILATRGITDREHHGEGTCHSIAMLRVLCVCSGTAITKVPVVSLYRSYLVGGGIGKEGSGLSKAKQAVIVKIYS